MMVDSNYKLCLTNQATKEDKLRFEKYLRAMKLKEESDRLLKEFSEDELKAFYRGLCKNQSSAKKIVSAFCVREDEIFYAPSGVIGERFERKLKEVAEKANLKGGKITIYIEGENNDV